MSPFRIMRVRIYALLVMLALSMPVAAMYKWNGFPLQGNADNLAWAYNDTVTSGTANGSVYNRLRTQRGLSKTFLTGQANNRGDLNK